MIEICRNCINWRFRLGHNFNVLKKQYLLVLFCAVVTNNIIVCVASAENQVDAGDSSQSLPEARCSISLRFKRIGGSGPNHAYIVCETVGPDGKRTKKGYRGGPSGMDDYDLVPEGSHMNPNDTPSINPLEILSAELCTVCDCIENVLATIEGCCIAYELLGPNSNTVIYMALKQCMQGGIYPPLDSIPELLDINPVAWKDTK